MIGLIWPEQPLDMLSQHMDTSKPKSLNPARSFKECNSFKPLHGDYNDSSDPSVIPVLDLETVVNRKKIIFCTDYKQASGWDLSFSMGPQKPAETYSELEGINCWSRCHGLYRQQG
ncbi:unnamed protein product [Musa textilis]